MRTALRLLSTRYGAALTIVVLIVMVVGVFRGVAGSRDPGPVAPALEPSPTISTALSGGNDGLTDDLDGGDTAQPTLTASAAAEVKTVTTRFVAAWLKHNGVTSDQWRAGIAPYATTNLMTNFQDTDPAGVPANATAGDSTLLVRDPAFVEATVPLDNGTLRLGLVVNGGHWKVDTVDWTRPS
jgi:hypothetical protein